MWMPGIVGWAKARLCALCPPGQGGGLFGGYASLCPPYEAPRSGVNIIGRFFTYSSSHVPTQKKRPVTAMKPASFRYHAPQTIEEALAMLAEYAPDDGRVLAGGQSLVPTMAFRLARPHHLVDINGIEALRRLAIEDGKLVIGAGVRHQAFHRPVVEGPLGALLSAVMIHISLYPIPTHGSIFVCHEYAEHTSARLLPASDL